MTRQRNQPLQSSPGLAFTAAVAVIVLSSLSSAQLTTPSRQLPSLRNFQIATSADGTIPNGCLQVYNSPIVGCTDNEFINTRCSQSCVRAVLGIQGDIQDACADVSTDPRTLLGQAMLGNLVQVLCTTEPIALPAPSPTTAVPNGPTPPGSGRGGDENSTPLNFRSSQSTSTTTVTSTSSDAVNPINTDDSSGAGNPVAPPPGQSTDDDNNNNDQGDGDDGDEKSNGAGGSPFDIVAGGDAGRMTPLLVPAVALAAGVAVVLLR